MTQPEFVHESASTSTIAPELRDSNMSPFSTSESASDRRRWTLFHLRLESGGILISKHVCVCVCVS